MALIVVFVPHILHNQHISLLMSLINLNRLSIMITQWTIRQPNKTVLTVNSILPPLNRSQKEVPWLDGVRSKCFLLYSYLYDSNTHRLWRANELGILRKWVFSRVIRILYKWNISRVLMFANFLKNEFRVFFTSRIWWFFCNISIRFKFRMF